MAQLGWAHLAPLQPISHKGNELVCDVACDLAVKCLCCVFSSLFLIIIFLLFKGVNLEWKRLTEQATSTEDGLQSKRL